MTWDFFPYLSISIQVLSFFLMASSYTVWKYHSVWDLILDISIHNDLHKIIIFSCLDCQFFCNLFLPKCNWASSYFCILLTPPETLSSTPFWKDLDICISTKPKIQCQIQNLYKQLVNEDNAKIYIKNDSFVHSCSCLVNLLFSALLFFERVNYFVLLQFIEEDFAVIQIKTILFNSRRF